MVSPHLGFHTRNGCARVYLVLLRMAWLWFRSLGKEGCRVPSDFGLPVDVGGTTWGVVRDDHRESDTEAAALMSVSGRWLVTLDVKHPVSPLQLTQHGGHGTRVSHPQHVQHWGHGTRATYSRGLVLTQQGGHGTRFNHPRRATLGTRDRGYLI